MCSSDLALLAAEPAQLAEVVVALDLLVDAADGLNLADLVQDRKSVV